MKKNSDALSKLLDFQGVECEKIFLHVIANRVSQC